MSVFGPWLPMPQQQQFPPGDGHAGAGHGGSESYGGGDDGSGDGGQGGRDRQDRGRETREAETGSIYGGPGNESPAPAAPAPNPDLDVAPLGIEDTKLHDDNMKNVSDFIESELAKGTQQAERNAAIASKIAGMSVPGLGSLLGELIGQSIRDKQEAFAKGVRGIAETDTMAAAVEASLGPAPNEGSPGNQGEGPPGGIIPEQEPPEPEPEPVLPEGVDPDDETPGLEELTDPFEGDALKWAQRVRSDIKRAGARLAQV